MMPFHQSRALLVEAAGIEPATLGLQSRRSPAELSPHNDADSDAG